jgi:pilus assembly protein FimV
MVAKSFGRALALLLLSPPAAFALGLGDIHLQSSLNAPLNAEVDLVGATPEDLTSLHAVIANHDTFTRYGLDWPSYLGGISMHVAKTPDGRDVIKVTSSDAITEPFVTFLIDVSWARGQLVREYTVLLDPPLYTPGQNAANQAPVAAPAVSIGTREGAINRAPTSAPPPASTAAPSESAGSSQASAPGAPPARSRTSASVPSAQPGSTRTVQRGDTLSQIAGSISSSGGPSTRSWMVAIYQANPSAFESNMNLMHAGAVLRIPDAGTATAISPTDALTEIRRQYAAWRNQPAAAPSTAASTESGRLHLVPPTEPAKPSSAQPAATQPGAASGASNTTALEARMHELEAQLQESRRLLEARNADLAKLQTQLGARNGAAPSTTAAPAPSAAPPSTAATPAPGEVTPPAATATPPAATSETAAPPEAQPAAPKPHRHPVTHPPVSPAPEGESFLSKLMHYWWIVAIIVAALLARLGISAWRSRQESQFDDSLGRLASAGADSAMRDPLGDTAKLRALRDPTIVVEESGAHERATPRPLPAAAPAPTAATRPAPVADTTLSNETAINLDQGDPLAEADFHMAYGLYDQAADLVRIAIARDPERRDLKLKLLEVFFVWGNKDQFLQCARELASTRDQAQPGEWEKIVIMGKQLAPEDPLFSGGAAVSGAAAGGVDLDLEGGESRVDFDLLGEPVPEDAAQGLDLDIGSALGDSDAASSSQTTRATDANLALHGLEDSASATTRQMTLQATADGVEPTVEQPNLQHDDNPTIRQKVERALRQGGGGGEQTAELAIDDLGLDLGGVDTVDHPHLHSTPDAPTLVAGLDDTSRQAMHDELAAHATVPGNAATGAWRVKPEDMDATLPPVALSEFDDRGPVSSDATSATAHLASLKHGEGLDFDLTDMDGSTAAAPGVTSDVDLDVGPTTAADTHFTITQKLSSEELALPDLEPATMSEVGTKLDLARAYMDMGDPEGARNILEEVLTEGSVVQKQEAQRLLQSLPG